MDRHDPRTGGEITDGYHMAMETAIGIGDLRRARDVAELVARDEVARTVVFLTTSRMVIPLALMGDFDAALAEADAMRAAWHRAGQPVARWMAPAAAAAALVHGVRGNRAGFDEWFAYSRRLATHVDGFGPFAAGRVALHEGRLADALVALDGVDHIRDFFDPYTIALRADVAAAAAVAEAPELIARAQPVGIQNDWAQACLARAEGRLSGDDARVRDALAGFERIGARFEWATTALLVADCVSAGQSTLRELGCQEPAP